MKLKKDLIKIINDNNLCISENPYGIRRLWPNSYIELFYNEFFNHIYSKNKSPHILEINQSNNNNTILWQKFFKNSQIISIDNEDINKNRNQKYDVIIISNKNKLDKFDSISEICDMLNIDGIIIFENIGRDLFFILKMFFLYFNKFELVIRDFRLHRFILKNCILTLSYSKRKFNIKNKFSNLLLLTKFIITETIISILLKFFKN